MRLILALCACAVAAPVSAQNYRGVVLGQPISDSVPTPVGTEVAAPFAYTLWAFEDEGLSMSATADSETGDVVYLEMWRSLTEGTQRAPFGGMYFGETTRGDLAERFGSEGIVFENRGRFAEVGPLAVYFISYEIEGSDTIVSFVTVQPLAEASEETADASVLDSVIVADGAYLDLAWGVNRGRLPDYTPIADPFE